MLKQEKKIVVNTVIKKQDDIIKKAEQELVSIQNAENDMKEFIKVQKEILEQMKRGQYDNNKDCK